MLKLLLFTFSFVVNTNALYNSLEWSSCNTASDVSPIRIDRLSVTPMVFIKIRKWIS